jgi:1-acyl-sn-glycerol-3-phosphate acyltransferase
VREALVALQRRLVGPSGVVMDGRDIGTVVLPEADVKAYLVADPGTRAQRRQDEGAVHERDARDSGRETSPLRAAPDALVIDTTHRTPEEVADEIVRALEPRPAAAESPARARDRDAGSAAANSVRIASTTWARVLRRSVWCFALAVLAGFFRLTRRGRANVPATGPAILAANHRSLLDIPLVALLTGRTVWFMGKEELFHNPVLGGFLSALGGFPVRRGRADRGALSAALDLLARGQIVVVYPEGTRTPGARFDHLEQGLAFLALKSGAPVVPIGISGSQAVFPPGRRLPKLVRLHINAEPPVYVGGPTDAVVTRAARHEATEKLRPALQRAIRTLEP